MFVCLRGTFFFFSLFFFFLDGLWLGWVGFGLVVGGRFFRFFLSFNFFFYSCRNSPWFYRIQNTEIILSMNNRNLPNAIRLLERLDKQWHIELIRGLERRTKGYRVNQSSKDVQRHIELIRIRKTYKGISS